MYVYMYIYMYVRTQNATNFVTWRRLTLFDHICMSVYMYTCVYVYMYVCIYVCTHACMYVCMHVRMYTCTPVNTVMNIFVHALSMYVCMYDMYTHRFVHRTLNSMRAYRHECMYVDMNACM